MQPPPYWADCPLIGKPIEGTPFITAKTPIQPYKADADAASSSSSSPSAASSSSSSSALPQWSIPLESTFTLSMLIRYHQQRGMQLGMIVDLTDGRFYEPQPLCRDNDITYINMYIPPPDDTLAAPASTSAAPSLPYGLTPHFLSAFFRLLDTFTASHPSSYLLLHDIYSFDLSLFLLSLYLTTNSLPPSLAFHRCCASRPPGISDEPMVRCVWAEGGEEVEWDVKAVLKRPEWMGEEVTNWTWSGAGDRMEKRLRVDEDKEAGEEKAGEVEERKEPVRPPGTVRRKQPKKTADSVATAAVSSAPSSSSPTIPSSSISIASSSDPYADMLADIGLATSAPTASSAPSSGSFPSSSLLSSGSHKRKAPSASPPTRPAPSTSFPSPSSLPPLPPAPHTNGTTASATPSTTLPLVYKRHSYLVAVQQPHLQRLLSTLLHLVLVPSSHYSPSSFPQSSTTDIRAKLIMLASWLDRRPVTRDVLDSMVRERSQWSLSWSPVCDECLVLIMKEGTFLLFVSAIAAATSTSSASSPSSLPPLYHVPHLTFPTKSSPTTLVSNTVAVGSLLFDIDQRSPTSPPTPRLLLTDLLSSPPTTPSHPLSPAA